MCLECATQAGNPKLEMSEFFDSLNLNGSAGSASQCQCTGEAKPKDLREQFQQATHSLNCLLSYFFICLTL